MGGPCWSQSPEEMMDISLCMAPDIIADAAEEMSEVLLESCDVHSVTETVAALEAFTEGQKS